MTACDLTPFSYRNFQIAGDGPDRHQVIDAANKLSNLKYLGWLTRKQMLEAMDQADILVLPSHVESFGTIAMEAMARLRHVRVSGNYGIREWSELKPGLFIVDKNEQLGQAI